ncbi:MAG: GNAT family N-acetyltransferase [Alphaproteobacteria bacterium]
MAALDAASLRFRPYAPGDLAAARRLHARSFAALAAGHYAPADIAGHAALIAAKDYAEDLARSRLIVAETPGAGLVASGGWIALDGEPGTARVRKLFVAPEAAGRGIGRSMLARIEDAARAAGHARFFLRAYLNAAAFYRAAGYRDDGPGGMALPGGREMRVLFMRKERPHAALQH